ncbi:MAG: division/cell wall cluster transcriptional repressor MraZ [Myxococcota bacterium]|nr:division/cell wall cluster transcriptional repressor MraZ [Myxococcota bacterium]
MFRGRHSHTIDAKGRVSIPTGYRQELQQDAERPPFLTAGENQLNLYPAEDWCAYERKMLADAEGDLDAQDIARMVISSVVEAPIDKQGRILVPQYLREMAGLEKEVTIAGVGDYVEVWDTARFRMALGQVQSNFRSIHRGFGGSRRSKESI